MAIYACRGLNYRFLGASRISVSNCTSLEGADGAADVSGVLCRFMPLIPRNNATAIMRELTTMVADELIE